jgi:nardilysin
MQSERKMNQVQVLKNPIKSTGDKKEYRLIRLPNHVTALLVRKVNANPSDADSEDLAAANVTVKIGSFDDPTNVQGLAHFLEHMVHMGSTRYPKESEYNDFMTANGGKRNAMTSAEYTTYFFAVSEKAFPEAVDRLEQLMEKPLLLQNSMQREREAVDSEFQMQVSSDAARVQSIFKVLIRESHPASKFNCGNLKTLKEEITDDDLHRELMKLHEKYVGSNMFVALQSQRTIDEMQEIVVKNFSSIKRGNNEEVSTPTLTPDEIFTPEFFNKIHFIKPKTLKKALIISWAFPKMDQHYKCAPLDYIKKIFRNSGEGGIASVLRESHLASDMGLYLEPNSFVSNSSFSLVRLVADLTDHGAENIDKILELIFSYLMMIKETSIDEHRRFYSELKEQSENDFNFHEESSAVDNVLDYVTNMITFEQQDYLRGNSLFQEFNEKIIIDAIEMMNQRKFNIIILDNKHESYNKREKFYGTEYDELDFPEDYKKLWDERKQNPIFFLEKFNPFKTSNFEIFENEEESQVIEAERLDTIKLKHCLLQKFPMKISDDGSFESWHKLDKKFKNPFAIFKLNLFSPFISASKEK